MYTVASPEPNPRGQLPNPNECNSTLTSGTKGIYRYLYIYIDGEIRFLFKIRF